MKICHFVHKNRHSVRNLTIRIFSIKKGDIAQGAHITYKAGDSVFCSQTL